jgi:hypothetical protein
MGMGPIPWTAVDRYALRHKLSDGEFEILLYMVRKMDDAWLEYQAEEGKKARASK